MKIAFLGDSITKGDLGVSFVDILQTKLKEHELVNYGKGGDTVSSLKKRIMKIPEISSYDVIVIFVGVNDVLGKFSFAYKIVKILMRQRCAKGIDALERDYRDIIEFIQSENTEIFVIPPLLIGEDITNRWNIELVDIVSSIETIVKEYSNIEYLDVRSSYLEYLSDKQISEYIPYKLSKLLDDKKNLHTDEDVDERSESRGLHLTLDGVHINSKGANILANSIFKSLTKEI